MSPLTPRDAACLAAIRALVARTGLMPTRRELARQLGLTSPGAVTDPLTALVQAGLVRVVPGVARGIVLVEPDTGDKRRL